MNILLLLFLNKIYLNSLIDLFLYENWLINNPYTNKYQDYLKELIIYYTKIIWIKMLLILDLYFYIKL